MERSKYVVVVPCFNEEKTLRKQVTTLAQTSDVIVVDDGSSDSSASILSNLQSLIYKVHILRHDVNLGYSKTIVDGIELALSMEYQFIVTTDADGEINPSLIPIIFNELEKGFDIVIGVRSNISRFAEKISALFTFVMWGIGDPLCGLKGYKAQALKEVNHLYTYDSYGTEILYNFLVKGFKFSSIFVDITPREDHSRIGSVFTANFKIMKALLLSINFIRTLQKRKNGKY